VALEVSVGLEPVSTTEWNLIQMSHVGPCFAPDPNNVTGDSWSRTSGYNGNNTWHNAGHHESKYTMELLSFILDLVLLGMIIWFVFTWLVSRHLERQIGSVVQDLDQERLIPLTVEVDQNQYFCYNTITKDFVCQGHSLKEIVDRFKQRYPDKSAAIYDGDETAVRTLKSQLKDLDENRGSI
jgi:hypothetical protein